MAVFIMITQSCTENNYDPAKSIPQCSFGIDSIKADSDFELGCLLDLKGQTINLPANVRINYNGGDIINGKLIFSGGTIDGRFLNSSLQVEGVVLLKDTIFKFDPDRWENITEGRTTSGLALKNTLEIERLMQFTKQLGATVFEIDEFDAYFEVTKVTSTTSNQNFYPHKEAINIPSDFHLKMSDKTHLRVFPAEVSVTNAALVAVYDVANAVVSGGNLHGDRDTRAYPPDENAEVGTHLLLVRSGVNSIIDGVYLEGGSAGGIDINSDGFFINPADYKPTTNILIKNCTIKDCRMMGIALTDGHNITIEGNIILNTAQPSANSDGGVVAYAINIEPWRMRDEEGNLLEYQKVYDVMIKGNIEKNSRIGFVTVTIGQDVTVSENNSEGRIVYSLASGTRIIGNRLKASPASADKFAIFCGGEGETVFDNEVAGNEISGFSLGIATGTTDTYVHDNTITECNTGIQIQKTFNSIISNNTIVAANMGINATNTYNNNVEVKNNIITSQRFLIYLTNLNNSVEYTDYRMTFDGNQSILYAKMVTISNANGINFTNNNIKGGIEIGNATNIVVSANTIRPATSDGIRFFNSHTNVSATDNIIYKASQFECIRNNSTTPAAIILTNNTCN